MNIRNSKSVHGVNLVSAFALTVVLLATSGLGAQEDRWDSQGRGLEGTWRVQVSVKDCQTGVVQRTFPALFAFAKGGTLTEATAGQSPALFTPGFGVWRHAAGRAYTAAFETFVLTPRESGYRHTDSREPLSWTGTRTTSPIRSSLKFWTPAGT
jgi:hypothetical protein